MIINRKNDDNHRHPLPYSKEKGDMIMATINVSIPDPLKDWIDAQVVPTGQYKDDSDYIRVLIQRDQEEKDSIQIIQKAIDEGLKSGVSEKSFDDAINEAHAEATAGKNDL